jgi:hypothetical protein
MCIEKAISAYIASQPASKQRELETLHDEILQLMPGARLWYLDGKNAEGKVVSNPNIGYGVQHIKYADGTSREFYQIGLSANSTGISVYIMGLEDKKYLPETFGKKIGKANVTGYCIKFKSIKDIHLDVLKEAISSRLKVK